MKIFLYFHTLKYLQFSQIYFRLLKRIRRPVPRFLTGTANAPKCGWVDQKLYPQKVFDAREVFFLNKRGVIEEAGDWNNTSAEKLWLYNAHYFDDLCAFNACGRRGDQERFIAKWINENPAPYGNGWEPYPTSLRIVNWVKAFLGDLEPTAEMLDSLAVQTDYLSQDLERHLRGNHLFVNGKALIFSALYLESAESRRWLELGLAIIEEELSEQILSDGGNFELSPMYHSIMLLDVLDMLNIANAYPDPSVVGLSRRLHKAAAQLLGWMDVMLHPDDEIAFFNDAAIGIAPPPAILREYASKLGVIPNAISALVNGKNVKAYGLAFSGYIRVEALGCVALLDCAKVGPDYLPGHAHADTLSFEMSLFGQRVFVNSGTSCYGVSDERLRQRSTAAHNSVVVDEMNSSEVWSGFRVARRAYPSMPVYKSVDNGLAISCSHNGYRRFKGRATHSREWSFSERSLVLSDAITGRFSVAKGYFHIHPSIVTNHIAENEWQLKLNTGEEVVLYFNSVKSVSLKCGTWHPEFGKSIDNNYFEVEFGGSGMQLVIRW